jgi:protein translocase subunit secG
MYIALVVLLVLDCIALVALILVQQGKGADAGAAFGSGASGTVSGRAVRRIFSAGPLAAWRLHSSSSPWRWVMSCTVSAAVAA